MPDVIPVVPPPPEPTSSGSAMRRLLTLHGAILMKENRPLAYLPTTYGAAVEVSGQVLAVIRGAQREISVGMKFEHPETSGHISSAAFVDSDELDELMASVEFLRSTAEQMKSERRDYTEVTYLTRDNVVVGFYQKELKQQAFARLGTGSPTLFLPIASLIELREAIHTAQEYLANRSAAWQLR